MMNQKGRPCKFGYNCNKFKMGTCTFLHDQNPNEPNHSNINSHPGNNNQYPGNYPNKYPGGGKSGGDHYKPPHNKPPHNQSSNNQPPHNQPNPNQDITNSFCRFFQASNNCKQLNKCKRLHEFTNNGRVNRTMFEQTIPTHQNSSLGCFCNGQQKFYSLKTDKQITFFQYDPINNSIKLIQSSWNLPEEYKYHYFETKSSYLFFAFENNNTKLSTLGVYDIFNAKVFLGEAAHQKEVTSMACVKINSEEFIVSASRDGSIKAFKLGEGVLVFNKSISDSFKSCYDNSVKIQILSLSVEDVGGQQVLWAGTSDSRLLLWIGAGMDFKQIVFEGPCNKIMNAKFFNANGNWLGIALTWSQDNKLCAVFGIMVADFSYQLMFSEDAQDLRNLITSIECTNDLLFTSNVKGTIMIYQIPSFTKIGCIMCNHMVHNMVITSTLTQTNIPLTNLLLLEKTQKGKNGSLQIFVLS